MEEAPAGEGMMVITEVQVNRCGECSAYIYHTACFYRALAPRLHFLQDDTMFYGTTYHSSAIVEKVWNISQASRPPDFIPYADVQFGSMNIVADDRIPWAGPDLEGYHNHGSMLVGTFWTDEVT